MKLYDAYWEERAVVSLQAAVAGRFPRLSIASTPQANARRYLSASFSIDSLSSTR